MNLSTTRYGHLKYTIVLSDIVALGANLSGDIALDSLPPGALVYSYLIKASTAVSGPAIATATLRPKLNGTLLGSAATDVFTTTGASKLDNTVNPASLTAANALVATLTLTGANANVATAGQIDVVLNFTTLAV